MCCANSDERPNWPKPKLITKTTIIDWVNGQTSFRGMASKSIRRAIPPNNSCTTWVRWLDNIKAQSLVPFKPAHSHLGVPCRSTKRARLYVIARLHIILHPWRSSGLESPKYAASRRHASLQFLREHCRQHCCASHDDCHNPKSGTFKAKP